MKFYFAALKKCFIERINRTAHTGILHFPRVIANSIREFYIISLAPCISNETFFEFLKFSLIEFLRKNTVTHSWISMNSKGSPNNVLINYIFISLQAPQFIDFNSVLTNRV